MARKKTLPVRIDVVEKLMDSQGFSVERLAEAADINPRNLGRILKGQNAHLGTIQALAKALGVSIDTLRADLKIEPIPTVTDFKLDLSILGRVRDPAKLGLVIGLTRELIDAFAKYDIEITHTEAQLGAITNTEQAVFVYNVFWVENTFGEPHWMFHASFDRTHEEFLSILEKDAYALVNEKYGFPLAYGEGEVPDVLRMLEISKKLGYTEAEFYGWFRQYIDFGEDDPS